MNKLLLSVILSGGLAWSVSAEETSRTLYFDFGSITESQGTVTEGADANGNFWNNITNNVSGNKYANSGTVYDNIVCSDNSATGFKVTLNSRFSTNGKSGGGGLLTPSAELLGDLAVATATEDYFFIESNENNSNFTISGLNPDRGYRFHIFASRKAGDTRIGTYKMEGLNKFSGDLQLAGTEIGHNKENQNTSNILVSDLVFPDTDGNITFTVSRHTGAYIALNAMKVEEVSGAEKPVVETVLGMTLYGDAAENGESLQLRMISTDGKNSDIFEGFTMLKPGSFLLSATTDKGNEHLYGVVDGKLVKDASDNPFTVEAEQLSMIRVDMASGDITIVPITSWSIVGSVVTGGWNQTAGEVIEYQGNGIWRSTVEMSRVSPLSDRERFIFVMNKSWDYQMKRVKGTERSVGFASDGFSLEDININHGKYTVTLDLNEFSYYIESPDGINENRISVMGSSVANGQGATDNHGYAYMYGQQLDDRFQNGASENPFEISGISINGNSTVNLLGRYNDLIHDFGRYVIFGVSLGNEGIHGAADQEQVFNQFRDNMLTLIAKAREDGKIPVVMNNYTRGDFEAADYGYVRRMNLLINSWDVPSVNLLGAIDNGAGQWADGYQNGDDIYHPNTDGHAEFMYAMPPSLFDAIKDGKALPTRQAGNSVLISSTGKVEFTPEGTVHPFALVINLNKLPEGNFATIATADGNASLSVAGQALTYTAPDGTTISGQIPDGDNICVTLSHYYAQGRTLLYAGDGFLGEIPGKITPQTVTIAPASGQLNLSEVMFFRSALNADEVAVINAGGMLKSSLEMYLPFSDSEDFAVNTAQSMAKASVTGAASSGINTAIVEDDANATFQVFGLKGIARVTVSAATGISIHSIDGRLQYRRTVNSTTDFPLSPGLYLVNGVKVAVR